MIRPATLTPHVSALGERNDGGEEALTSYPCG